MPSHQDGPRKLLFYRDFERYSGGHGKVWDYFCHAGHGPGWSPAIYLSSRSRREQNPWCTHDVAPEPRWDPGAADALFLGGLDWRAYPQDDPGTPVINLVQHVRHGDPADPRHAFLKRRAIRICVSQEVADAIQSDASPNGPVLVIEAAIQLPQLAPHAGTRTGIFIDAIKQQALGQTLAKMLRAAGRHVDLNDQRIPRQQYLERLNSAAIAVVLPRATEGFYLPGLEAMALGCATVVPDCVGNRAYLEPGRNALAPPLDAHALAAAVQQLDNPQLRQALAERGRETATRFGIAGERAAFRRILAEVDRLWRA